MTAADLLDSLPTDERETFLLSPPNSETQELFDAAVTFGDNGSIRDLRLRLNKLVRLRRFLGHVEGLQDFAGDDDELGVQARLMLRAREIRSGIPEAAFPFLDAFALIAATCLRDSRTGAGRHRARLITELLDEAKTIEEKRRAA